MRHENNDPPKTAGLGPKAISSNKLTKKQLARQQRLADSSKKTITPQVLNKQKSSAEIINYLSDEKRAARFAKGMGIKKIEVNRKKNTIQFELEEDFNHMLKTICSWKNINPEEYLSQLLTEYFLTLNHTKMN